MILNIKKFVKFQTHHLFDYIYLRPKIIYQNWKIKFNFIFISILIERTYNYQITIFIKLSLVKIVIEIISYMIISYKTIRIINNKL